MRSSRARESSRNRRTVDFDRGGAVHGYASSCTHRHSRIIAYSRIGPLTIRKRSDLVFFFFFLIDHSTSLEVAMVHRHDVSVALARRKSGKRPNSSSCRNYSWCSVAYKRGSSSSIAISIIGTNKWLDNDWKIFAWSKVGIPFAIEKIK